MHASFKRNAVALIMFVAFAAILALVLVWLQGLPGTRPYAAYANLRNLYQALRCYDDKYGCLPPAASVNEEGEELSSWRTEVYQIDVELGHYSYSTSTRAGSINYDRSKGWNDPANLRLQKLGEYSFEYAHRSGRPVPGDARYRAYYKAIVGPDTAFERGRPRRISELPADLILVVRVEQSDTHWMEPGDLSVEELMASEEQKRLLARENGYAVVFADGKPWVLSSDLPFAELRKFLTISSAERFNRDEVLGPYRLFP